MWPMVLFIYNVKKIKGAAHKNDDVDGTCKRTLESKSWFQRHATQMTCYREIGTICPAMNEYKVPYQDTLFCLKQHSVLFLKTKEVPLKTGHVEQCQSSFTANLLNGHPDFYDEKIISHQKTGLCKDSKWKMDWLNNISPALLPFLLCLISLYFQLWLISR